MGANSEEPKSTAAKVQREEKARKGVLGESSRSFAPSRLGFAGEKRVSFAHSLGARSHKPIA
jgi:hypothetical protein